MDRQDDLERLLTEIRDSERLLVEEMRKLREWSDYDRHSQKAMRLVLAGVLGVFVLVVVAGSISTWNRATSEDTAENPQRVQYQRQLDRSDVLYDQAEKREKRSDDLQSRWEKQLDRVEALIGKWEKAVPKSE